MCLSDQICFIRTSWCSFENGCPCYLVLVFMNYISLVLLCHCISFFLSEMFAVFLWRTLSLFQGWWREYQQEGILDSKWVNSGTKGLLSSLARQTIIRCVLNNIPPKVHHSCMEIRTGMVYGKCCNIKYFLSRMPLCFIYSNLPSFSGAV